MRRAVVAGGGFRAVLLPQSGAGIASLTFQGRDLLRPAREADIRTHHPSGSGSFLMAPWTNRLDGGRLRTRGRTWRLPVNRPEDRTAIHGFLRDMPWRVVRRRAGGITLAVAAHRPPWRIAATFDIGFAAGAATMTLSVVNRGRHAVPVGIGLHPWFPRRPDSTLRFAATAAFGADARTLPTTAAPATGMHGRLAARLGHDGHWAGWDGRARLDGLAITAGGAFRNLHVYVPAQDPVVCVEPVSHVPNVANRPDLAAYGPMRPLAPGRAIRGWMRLHCAT